MLSTLLYGSVLLFQRYEEAATELMQGTIYLHVSKCATKAASGQHVFSVGMSLLSATLYLHNADPESLEWNLLDNDLRKNLDTHHYFSLSGSRKDGSNTSETNGTTQAKSTSEDPKPKSEIDYTSLELDSDNESADDTVIPEGSLFDYHVPGILTKEEVAEKLDLNHWKLLVRRMLVDMEDLNGWESSKITDPQSLKGIVAELAAALGPEVVGGGSAVNLF
jgi:arginyl-tRNA---protein transferase